MHSRNGQAAKRFFCKALKAAHNQKQQVINLDKNVAALKAIDELKKDQFLAKTTERRRLKYLNNIVEQDHQFIKRLVSPGKGFGSFNTARQTLRGYEAMNMICKGQVQGVEKGNIMSQVEFVAQIFPVAA